MKRKYQIYKKAGVIPYFGGTLFEAFIIRNMFREFVEFLDKYEIELVEVSDGSYDIEHDRKLEYISRLAERGTVISEVGSKKKDVVYSPDEWVAMMKAELDAGSVKVIAEARESGTTGIYNEDGSINNKIISAISEHVKLENVIWEAPLKSQQTAGAAPATAFMRVATIPPLRPRKRSACPARRAWSVEAPASAVWNSARRRSMSTASGMGFLPEDDEPVRREACGGRRIPPSARPPPGVRLRLRRGRGQRLLCLAGDSLKIINLYVIYPCLKGFLIGMENMAVHTCTEIIFSSSLAKCMKSVNMDVTED